MNSAVMLAFVSDWRGEMLVKDGSCFGSRAKNDTNA